MKKLLLLLTVLILSSMLLLSCKNNKKLVVGTIDNMPPFSYRGGESGEELVGFDIEFANMIANDLGRELEIQTFRFEELIPAIIENKIDVALAAIFITEERKKMVGLSKPYYESFQVILVRKDDNRFDDVTDEKQMTERIKSLASQLNTVGMTAAAYIAGDNPVVGFRSLDRAIDELINKNVDAVISDKMTANRYVANNTNLAILPKIEFFPRYYGVAVNKNNNKLLTEINNAISKSIFSGVYMDWVNKYMGNHDIR